MKSRIAFTLLKRKEDAENSRIVLTRWKRTPKYYSNKLWKISVHWKISNVTLLFLQQMFENKIS